MQVLSEMEIQEVTGATNWKAAGQGAILIAAGAAGVATGGFALVFVGGMAMAFGSSWFGYGMLAN
jgi:hypothetical protein